MSVFWHLWCLLYPEQYEGGMCQDAAANWRIWLSLEYVQNLSSLLKEISWSAVLDHKPKHNLTPGYINSASRVFPLASISVLHIFASELRNGLCFDLPFHFFFFFSPQLTWSNWKNFNILPILFLPFPRKSPFGHSQWEDAGWISASTFIPILCWEGKLLWFFKEQKGSRCHPFLPR